MIPAETYICKGCKAFIDIKNSVKSYPMTRLLRLGLQPMCCRKCGMLQPPHMPRREIKYTASGALAAPVSGGGDGVAIAPRPANGLLRILGIRRVN